MAWKIVAYQDEQTRQPVNDFIASLPQKDQARIYWTLDLLREFGLDLKTPYARPVHGKLWELRVQSGRDIYRILYFAHTGQRFVLLHGFRKKTQKTPRNELDIAERRLNDVLARTEEE
jgi:phage-related protein